jgi:alpha-aminoadipate carrier protein LysW
MVNCPVCEGAIDVDEEDVDEGDTLSCDECGADLKVVSTSPLEIESAEEFEEDEDEDEDFLDEDEEEEAEGEADEEY